MGCAKCAQNCPQARSPGHDIQEVEEAEGDETITHFWLGGTQSKVHTLSFCRMRAKMKDKVKRGIKWRESKRPEGGSSQELLAFHTQDQESPAYSTQ